MKAASSAMTAEWQEVTIAGQEGTSWYLHITPKPSLLVQGDFRTEVSFSGPGDTIKFYFWLDVPAIMWNEKLKDFDKRRGVRK